MSKISFIRRFLKPYRSYVFLMLFSVVFTIGYHLLMPGHSVKFKDSLTLHISMDSMFTFLLLFAVWESNAHMANWLDSRYRWEKSPWIRMILQVVLNTVLSSVLIVVMVSAYGYLLNYLFPDPVMMQKSQTKNILLENALIITPVFFVIYQLIFIAIFVFRQWSRTMLESEQLKKENFRGQLAALQAQVNPHFLFNSLNSLTMLITENQEQAVGFVQELANVYRYLLHQHTENLVHLKQEVEFIQSFIYLHRTRLGNSLKTKLSIPDSAADFYIAPTSLQLLVENAIKHNIASAEKPLFISIIVTGQSICVSNNLQPKLTPATSTGLGLQNLRERYRLISGREIIINSTENTFSVTIPLLHSGEINDSVNYRR